MMSRSEEELESLEKELNIRSIFEQYRKGTYFHAFGIKYTVTEFGRSTMLEIENNDRSTETYIERKPNSFFRESDGEPALNIELYGEIEKRLRYYKFVMRNGLDIVDSGEREDRFQSLLSLIMEREGLNLNLEQQKNLILLIDTTSITKDEDSVSKAVEEISKDSDIVALLDDSLPLAGDSRTFADLKKEIESASPSNSPVWAQADWMYPKSARVMKDCL